jgi:hypothetical protein
MFTLTVPIVSAEEVASSNNASYINQAKSAGISFLGVFWVLLSAFRQTAVLYLKHDCQWFLCTDRMTDTIVKSGTNEVITASSFFTPQSAHVYVKRWLHIGAHELPVSSASLQHRQALSLLMLMSRDVKAHEVK